jgi:hypothetical protein
MALEFSLYDEECVLLLFPRRKELGSYITGFLANLFFLVS